MPTTAKKEPAKKEEKAEEKTTQPAPNQVLVHKKKSDRVAICGFAPTSKDLAPFNDKGVEVWGCNELYDHIPRVDVIFEMHDRSEFESTFRNQRHLDWLRNATIPVYMVKHYDDIPNSIPYPLQHMTARFGTYFNNTISYMIALAILMQYKWIGIYGVDMAHSTEYGSQRPSCEYFIGWARGRAEIQGYPIIHIPEESELLKSNFLYGYVNGEKEDKIISQKIAHFTRQHQAYMNNELMQRDAKNQYLGAVQGLSDYKRTLMQYTDKDLVSEHSSTT